MDALVCGGGTCCGRDMVREIMEQRGSSDMGKAEGKGRMGKRREKIQDVRGEGRDKRERRACKK